MTLLDYPGVEGDQLCCTLPSSTYHYPYHSFEWAEAPIESPGLDQLQCMIVCVVAWQREFENFADAVVASWEAQGRLVTKVSIEGRGISHLSEAVEGFETESLLLLLQVVGIPVYPHQRSQQLLCRWLEHQASLVEQVWIHH